MTTVGYGNQSPETTNGRSLVAGLAWISIILFGAISLVAGNVVSIIVNDFFRKVKLKFLSRSEPGLFIWFSIAVGWICFIGYYAHEWWRRRVFGFEVTMNESLWFAYISALTVGLGDFFLQPEVMFIEDVFIWSGIMLFGFVEITLVLNKV
mmetsp:Transcript_40958/g.98062  ORF Transcript_40958/g.98062 Transcript_40958/m.98062 type:complete len:151 (-) Transcript_40958:601-1053(-)